MERASGNVGKSGSKTTQKRYISRVFSWVTPWRDEHKRKGCGNESLCCRDNTHSRCDIGRRSRGQCSKRNSNRAWRRRVVRFGATASTPRARHAFIPPPPLFAHTRSVG